MPKILPSLSVAVRGAPAECEFRFALARAPDEKTLLHLRSVMEVWASLGRRGGYDHSQSADARPPSLEVLDDSSIGESYFVRLADVAIDLRAYQLLRNAAGRLALEEIEVRSITVRQLQMDIEPVRLPIPDEFNEPDVYPARSPRVHFPIEFEDSDFSKARRLLAEFAAPVDAADVDGIAKWVEAWNDALEAGCYAMPIGLPTEFQSLRGSTQQFDDISIEVSVFCFKASEMAWNGLVNCLAAYSRIQKLRLSRVLID